MGEEVTSQKTEDFLINIGKTVKKHGRKTGEYLVILVLHSLDDQHCSSSEQPPAVEVKLVVR